MRNLAPKTENDIWIMYPFWEFRCFFGQAVGGGTGKTESSENGCAPTSAHGKIPRHSRRGSIDNAQGVRAEVAVAPENQNAAFSAHDSFAPAAERGQSRRHFCRHAKQGASPKFPRGRGGFGLRNSPPLRSEESEKSSPTRACCSTAGLPKPPAATIRWLTPPKLKHIQKYKHKKTVQTDGFKIGCRDWI